MPLMPIRPRTAFATAALLALGTGAAPAPAQAAAGPRCNQLTGTVRIRTAKIKVVAREVKDHRLAGSRLYGCALPRGKVFVVGERGTPGDNLYYNSTYSQFGVHAGTYLVVHRSLGDGAAQTTEQSSVVMNLRDGSERSFYEGISGEGGCGNDEGSSSRSTPPVNRLVLRANGLLAVLYAARADAPPECYPNDGQAVLTGLLENGERLTLDLAPVADIPAESVSIVGTDFRWTRAGTARTESGAR